ncbi:hypothetical protein VFPPC_18353 [Pochonia chlamydosporia 170]|uniref:Uncharacterized protein n=1 Tax=Pochonia chlamydosporia 170 TaxID=1380566 RepID=A0A219AT86_METCM|nr:hypothetical protein VFPPC_18353 [Pochonia chlamydosporia 170]OWT43395.1 hypothetical protein VFPPC_18353 [Pochonia chlamydosporia 170]
MQQLAENPASLDVTVGCKAETPGGKARDIRIIVQELANMDERQRYLGKQNLEAIEASTIMCNSTNPETGSSEQADK